MQHLSSGVRHRIFSERCPCVGEVFNIVFAPLVEAMSSVALFISVTINLEVKIMTKTIIAMCLVAGTVLLGRSGDVFPELGEVGAQHWSIRH